MFAGFISQQLCEMGFVVMGSADIANAPFWELK